MNRLSRPMTAALISLVAVVSAVWMTNKQLNSKIKAPAVRSVQIVPTPPAPPAPEVKAKPRIHGPSIPIEYVDFTITGRSRMAIKVMLGVEGDDLIRSALRDIAKDQKADVVIVYGYLNEKDYRSGKYIGALEFSRTGIGWKPETTLPEEGLWKSNLINDPLRERQLASTEMPAPPSLVSRPVETPRTLPTYNSSYPSSTTALDNTAIAVEAVTKGRINRSLINTFRDQWRKEGIAGMPKQKRDEVGGLMVLMINTDCKKDEDKVATLMYMMQTMDSW